MTAIFAFLSGWLVSSYNYLISLLIINIRIQPEVASEFYNNFKEMEKNEFFCFMRTVGNEDVSPVSEAVIYRVQKRFVWLQFSEEFLRAGFAAKQINVFVKTFRWNHQWLYSLCRDLCTVEESEPKILLNQGAWISTFGSVPLPPSNYIVPKQASLFLSDIQKVLDGQKDKTGVVLTGEPGNGKSTFVKYLSDCFKLDIVAVDFSHEMTNNDILMVFRRIMNFEKPCIVLFEDFDNVFKLRESCKENIKYSFDAILNALDGAYFRYQKRIFVMTTNKISDLDRALKRPGRFDHIINFNKPNESEILEILPSIDRSLLPEIHGLTMAELSAFASVEQTKTNLDLIKDMFCEESLNAC